MAKKKRKGGQAAKPKSAEAQGRAKTEAGGEAKAEAKSAKKSKARGSESGVGLAGKVSQFREFLEEAKIELKKVTFPTRKETMATSAAVLVLVVIMSIFLGLVDLGLSKAIEAILS
jgi:preprotein translocase subunit SecE